MGDFVFHIPFNKLESIRSPVKLVTSEHYRSA